MVRGILTRKVHQEWLPKGRVFNLHPQRVP
jgi:hypothetical protein